MFPPPGLLNQGRDAAMEYLARVGEAGIDYVRCGDHVSFFGLGFDGLVQATALAMLHPTLPVHLGVYLLPLRDPVMEAFYQLPFERFERYCPYGTAAVKKQLERP